MSYTLATDALGVNRISMVPSIAMSCQILSCSVSCFSCRSRVALTQSLSSPQN